MKKLTNSLFVLTLCWCLACSQPEDKSLPQQVAAAYGIENFDKLNSIAYTWNVQVGPDVRTRDWKWNIKERTVYYAGPDTSYTYSLDLPKDELPQADAGFINDKYWLMYPFQLAWDSGYEYEVEENVDAPISGESTTKLTIIYNAEDGYTPGDAYDLYLDGNKMIKEWVFRKGNGEAGNAFTWESEKDFNGVTFATEHKNAEGVKFIWFTNIEVN
ncbi:hypothetical protein [Mongoliibacter ruber]|uniref:Uncharacterized protein n=1 Tax=Mongoliibacter ruber TaxID=1750599 RepID=A0A2T0WQK7_9BACT|nr:hypothetical protein [Mongoliibacter ruber]PRY88988.1 hypothetical protein CLW00_103108 [Mongoliibacter ruber]